MLLHVSNITNSISKTAVSCEFPAFSAPQRVKSLPKKKKSNAQRDNKANIAMNRITKYQYFFQKCCIHPLSVFFFLHQNKFFTAKNIIKKLV